MPVQPTDVVGWWQLGDAQDIWPDVDEPTDLDELARLLGVAYEQCEPRARILDTVTGVWRRLQPGDEIPERLREAQLQQARAVWSFQRTGGGDLIGADGMTVRVYPMGWQVQTMLFPDEAVGVIG